MVSTRAAARSNAAFAWSTEPDAPSNDARSSSCAREAAACCFSFFVGLGEGAAFADDRAGEGRSEAATAAAAAVAASSSSSRRRSSSRRSRSALRW